MWSLRLRQLLLFSSARLVTWLLCSIALSPLNAIRGAENARATEATAVKPDAFASEPLNEGIIAGEQLTPGAPWRIRITDELRAQVVEDVPEGYVTVFQAMKILGVSRQTVWQRVKRGELQAVHVRRGKRKGLRIRVLDQPLTLFDNA